LLSPFESYTVGKVEDTRTVREAAALLRYSTRTVYRMIGAGELPAAKVRKEWRIPLGAIRAVLTPTTRTAGETR
jgi:excisionase family DNA binding protein